MSAKVVDASALGAILFREPRAAEALALLRGSELHAPGLLAYELAHIAQKKASRYPAHTGAIENALKLGLGMEIHWREVDHGAVLRLAMETGLTTYDASYLYLSRALGASLATFDQRLSQLA